MPPKTSPKRRFLTAMLGGKPDRVPVGNVVSIVRVELMQAAGAWFPQAHHDSESMSRLAAAGNLALGYDTVMPVFSVVQEAAALGCQVDWGDLQTMPTVRSHPFASRNDFYIPDGWMEAPSIQAVLGALRLLRQMFGHNVVIVGKVMGPWSLSYHLMGMEEFLVSTILEPQRVRHSIESLKSVTIAFARAQIWAGADIICHGGPFDEPENVAEAMKRMPGINGFYGATSMERLPVERAIKEQVSKFKAMKLTA
jgi:MtaA/CmuA family methyltransferase